MKIREWHKKHIHPFIFVYEWAIPWTLLAVYFNIGILAFASAMIGVFGSFIMLFLVYGSDELQRHLS